MGYFNIEDWLVSFEETIEADKILNKSDWNEKTKYEIMRQFLSENVKAWLHSLYAEWPEEDTN